MTRRAADLRFLLAVPPATVALRGRPAEESAAWQECGVEVRTDGPADVVLAPPAERSAAVGAAGHAVLVPGRRVQAGAPSGWSRRRVLVADGRAGPRLLAAASADVRRCLGGSWSQPESWAGRARNLVLRSPAGVLAADLELLQRSGGAPYPLAAGARAAGLPEPASWFVLLREGDDLQRVVSVAVVDGRAAWVVKHSRVPGAPDRGAVEVPVLDRVRDRSADVARRLVRVLARFDLDGAPATVETAAPGALLTARLRRLPPAAAQARGQEVLDWVRSLGRATRDDAGAAAVDRLVRLGGPAATLAPALAGLPSVVAHNDLATWNVLDDGADFTVVDLESAWLEGLPLWDTAYLATDLLVEQHGPRDPGERVEWAVRLWRGELPVSPVLSGHLARAAADLGLPPTAVPALVASCWLHHGGSRARRAALGLAPGAQEGYLGAVGAQWAEDPALGSRWPGLHG